MDNSKNKWIPYSHAYLVHAPTAPKRPFEEEEKIQVCLFYTDYSKLTVRLCSIRGARWLVGSCAKEHDYTVLNVFHT